jgi:hypothetical protein
LRDNNLKQKFGTKLYGQEMFNLLLEAFDQVLKYPFQMKIAKNRFFELTRSLTTGSRLTL